VLVIRIFVSTGNSLAGENTPESWDKISASQYLDRRGESWFKFSGAHRGEGATGSSCVSCHSLLPYALARPILRRISHESQPTEGERKILEQTKLRVANWDRLDSPAFQLYYDFDDAKKKQSRGTESVLNALILALDDRIEGRAEPSEATKKALAILWSTQITDGPHKGSWEWLNFGMDPWESNNSPFVGACLAAIAVGAAHGEKRPDTQNGSQARIGMLHEYLRKNFDSQNLHNRAWTLWAASSLDGLLSPPEKDRLVAQLLAKQQSNGGWTLGSLGDFTHGEVKVPSKTPDGYATGLVLHTLQLSGLRKEAPEISKGLSWLRSNQDKSGAWRANSVNKNRSPESPNPSKANVGKFMWDAATGYAVLALSH
jgi:squalene-hopene/tetraprenyl-beta-curcumene cyclase